MPPAQKRVKTRSHLRSYCGANGNVELIAHLMYRRQETTKICCCNVKLCRRFHIYRKGIKASDPLRE